MIGVPTSLEAVTSAWLTAALRANGTIRRAAVDSFDTRRIAADASFTGGIARFQLDYTNPEEDAPATLVAKLVTFEPQERAFSQNSSRMEVRFFQELAARPDLPTPRCYYAARDPESGTCILLLEDLGPLRAPDLIGGCGPEDAELVIRQLAEMHAKWWQSPELRAVDWLPSIDGFAAQPVEQWWARYPRALAALLPDHQTPEGFLDIGNRFSKSLRKVFEPLATPPVTCMHRDVHAENIFFGGEGRPMVLIDWALVARGRGVGDVSYFLISSMTPGQRRRSEERLLEMYHRQLIGNGVRGYGFAECWSDYRRGIFAKLLVTVAATVLYDNSSAPRRAWRKVDLERLVAFAEDHAVAEFL